jgi:hypothetical protein
MPGVYEYRLAQMLPFVAGVPEEDRPQRQHRRVLAVLRDGRWHTLAEISRLTGYPEASVSARIRDFRKADFGSHVVEKRPKRRALHKITGGDMHYLAAGSTTVSWGFITVPLLIAFILGMLTGGFFRGRF